MGAEYPTLGRLKLAPARLLAGCYIDLGHRVQDTTLVVGTGRSGSTWLAEIINHRNEYRLVFEPFRGDRVHKARPFRRGHFIEPSAQDHPLGATIDALLAGRVRSWWTDRHNRRRLVTRRIVKEVRITNLLPWIRLRHPDLRIVYIVRDPVAVAKSWLELGWGDDLDELLAQRSLLERLADAREVIDAVVSDGEPFDRHVLRWCLENAIPLREHAGLDIHLVSYERLRDRPEREVERLFAYLGHDGPGDATSIRRPSATASFPRVRAMEIADVQLRRADAILSSFGVEPLLRAHREGAEPGQSAAPALRPDSVELVSDGDSTVGPPR